MKQRLRIGVFAKYPRPGRVKTRLAADLGPGGPRQAASIARAFIDATLTRMRRIAARENITLFADDWPPAPDIVDQGSGDLGQRLQRAFTCLLREASAAIIIGTDSPDLPLGAVDEAADALCNGSDVAIGPALDGGYTLIGMTRVRPALFEGIEWSTSAVLEQTLARCKAESLHVHLLEPWYDVDDLAALQRLLSSASQSNESILCRMAEKIQDARMSIL